MTWAAPYDNGMDDDSTRYHSQAGSPRDSMSKDSAAKRHGVTASDQTNNKADVDITAKIRREIMARKGMSVNAQNVKIVTIDGKVTLRGKVNSASEKKLIGQIATSVAGSENVTNELQVK
jgi:osmotically-inducible protein OsmY